MEHKRQVNRVSVRNRFTDCIAGVFIGSAMGAAVEGWTYQKIHDEYDLLDRFLPYEHYQTGINMGRDTDCVAAVTAGICGALSGTQSLPQEWIRQLDYATSVNPHTANKKTINEQADELYMAFENRMSRLRLYTDAMLGV